MEFQIALIKGDGIGPEIVDSAVRVLEKIGQKYGHTFHCTPYLAGGCAIDTTGIPLPEETVQGCLSADSVLLGAVGGPKWDKKPRPSPPGEGASGASRRAGALHQPAPGEDLPGAGRGLPPAA